MNNMGAEETKEKKKVLITYFENFILENGQNELCIGISDKLEEKYGKDNELVHFLGLRTTSQGTKINKNSIEKFNKIISENQYDYIISIGKGGKNIFERRKENNNCYIFTDDEISNAGFKVEYGPQLRDIGACFKVRDALIKYVNSENINRKIDFIHISDKYINNLDVIANLLINKIDSLIE